jgi:YHS domain-containing protein
MKYVNEQTQAVVLMICEKHAPAVLQRLNDSSAGNWFMLPSIQAAKMGYWSNVSEPHTGHGVAIFGFAESTALSRTLEGLASIMRNADCSLCSECVAYEWNTEPSHIAASAKDPVCGRSVSCSQAVSQCHHGELFFFCSFGCRDKFRANPQQYLPIRLKREPAEV